MNDDLGSALRAYEDCLRALRCATRPVPAVAHALFSGFEDWERQLTFKLAPRLAGDGCLIVVLAGGTNTGKSTVFNTLVGAPLSPVSPFGAHTRFPLVAANERRYQQCLEPGQLLPDVFVPEPWDPQRPEALTEEGRTDLPVFVARHDALPDRLVLLDTPDIDSIAKENWELAKNIREAGDVLVAVLTGQKYADLCVVEFLQEARRAGRYVVALMNMADGASGDFDVARRQLAEFRRYLLGAEEADLPMFVLPRLRADEIRGPASPVSLDDETVTLLDHLASLDAVELKRRILSDNLESFAQRADEFLERAGALGESLAAGVTQLEALAREASAAYEPVPGREVLDTVYDFAKQRIKGPAVVIGPAVATAAKLYGGVRRTVKAWFTKPRDLGDPERQVSQKQRARVEEIAKRLYARYKMMATTQLADWAPEAAHYLEQRLDALDPDPLASAIVDETFHSEAYVAAYRQEALKELEQRWKQDPKWRRALTLSYNLGLLGVAGGMMVLLSFGGWGQDLVLSEVLTALAAPLAVDTVKRLWGDTMVIRKWQDYQRRVLADALLEHLTYPALGELRGVADALGEHVATMKELNLQCRTET